MEIRSVGEKLLHADGPTDTTKVTDAFRKSAQAPKNFTTPQTITMTSKLLFILHLFILVN